MTTSVGSVKVEQAAGTHSVYLEEVSSGQFVEFSVGADGRAQVWVYGRSAGSSHPPVSSFIDYAPVRLQHLRQFAAYVVEAIDAVSPPRVEDGE